MLNRLKTQKKSLLGIFVAFAMLFTNMIPSIAMAEDLSGSKPLNYLGAYLTTITNNVSTTGADITTTAVPVKPLIKLVFDKNVVNDAVWTGNQKCVTMQTSTGTVISSQVTRIPDTVNFNERQYIFITPTYSLTAGQKYKVVISPNLLAKNLVSTLGATTNNQPIVVNFTVGGTSTVAVTGVTLNSSAMTITEGKTGTLTAAVAPSTATNKAVTWSSSNTSIATVNQSGTVTGILPGTAVITVTTVDGAKKASCNVTVKAYQVIYLVKSGDTLSSIAAKYAQTSNDLLVANNLSSSTIYVGQSIIIPTIAHIVQSGDTLSSIAAKYGATTTAITTANSLTSTTLYIGQKLFVPINLRIYTVVSGDTLTLAASKNATTVNNLIRLNNLNLNSVLYVGQKLKVNY